jgi:adenine-specific DNA-methyltransferase
MVHLQGGFVVSSHLAKFQQLLRELFQFDCADLDFGIYRIMNYKRDLIERFITQGLPRAVSRELEGGALAVQARAVEELEAAKKKLLEISDDAIDPAGNLVKYHDTKPGKRYLEARKKAKSAKNYQALEAAVYNHLYIFLNRYWQDGDFISKRRYSKNERYSIPYNGEEVMLYWANHDQYYIKTGEYFTDYSWKAHSGVTVYFKLTAADVEQNNVKGEKQFFLPRLEGITWEEAARILTIPFEFRPLDVREAVAYGRRNQQEAIISRAVEEISRQRCVKNAPLALGALNAEKRRTGDGKTVTNLEHHLRRYTQRNTSDFFIHKDLKGFLSRELDFYLKNEVLNLDELEAAGEAKAEGWFQMMRLIKRVGGHIIEFLTQIEEFQKMLWEKRKFITETFYCIMVGYIPEEFYPEIAECEAQWEEWKVLFHIDEDEANLLTVGKDNNGRRLEYLKAHPTLVLDTRHFASDFTDRLLASFDNLDEATDGLLVHSENWQALNLLVENYKERVDCIHIDPPYNTQTSGFLYKNNYKHSSWLAMMRDRITSALKVMSKEGAFLCHIDENEYERLHLLLDQTGIPYGGTIVWDKKNPMLGRKGIATQHEYVMWKSWTDESVYLRPKGIKIILNKAQSLIRKYGGVNETVRDEFENWIKKNDELTGGERAYCLIDDDGRVYQSVAMGAPEPRKDKKFYIPLIHPITKKPCPVPPNGWSRAPETLKNMLRGNEIIFGVDESVQPRRKVFLTEDSRRQLSSIVYESSRGKNDVNKLDLEFPYCHPVSLYETLIGSVTSENTEIILDYFAGSGTTGHAVINLNREDGGRRKFILVEMAQYFDTVLLPRIKKVTFSPEWKDGKPKRMATAEETEHSPRIVKVIRLESYEDALNNITLDDSSGQQALRFEDYLLQYMLKWETRKSETLLNVEKLAKPFSYQLYIHSDQPAGRTGGETPAQAVDLPETFAYLLGLSVEKRQVFNDHGRRYLAYRGTTREGRKTVVIWRETESWTAEDYKRDREFVAENNLTVGVDDVYVNGDSYIRGAQALEKLFKERMFATVEV